MPAQSTDLKVFPTVCCSPGVCPVTGACTHTSCHAAGNQGVEIDSLGFSTLGKPFYLVCDVTIPDAQGCMRKGWKDQTICRAIPQILL